MAHPITIPKLGQMTEESTIVRWLKKEGDLVKKGDILFEMETDKSVMEVESFFQGTLLKIVVPPGESVPVMTVVGFIGEPGDSIPRLEPPGRRPPESSTVESSPVVERPAAVPPAAEAERPSAPPVGATGADRPSRFRISPRAARLARECGVDPRSVGGSGPGGRVVERDVKAHLDARRRATPRIGPAARTLARREGIDVPGVVGTGKGGRILVEDVQRAVDEKPRPLSRMRRVIAKRLNESYSTIPHFFVTVSVDMTDLESRRDRLKAGGKSCSIGDFIVRAVALTLAEFPDVNSATDGENVWRRGRVHIGLAVALDEGLVVPVIRDADRLTLGEIHERAGELVSRARAGRLRPHEMGGSTFTVSNMGMNDVENFTAIINPGESAILAVSSITPKPVVEEDRVVIRPIMKMTLSADHRLIDGALAARFLNRLKQRLERPE
jgi:pyruvate dehydrogenase E2 component (dihydrolipoamide acetyltransferase)